MTTTDTLLIDLYSKGMQSLDINIPARDKKIMSSLARQILSGHFLTENQSNLLVKIFKENLKFLPFKDTNLINVPVWKEPFRVIQQFRKISLTSGQDQQISVEFTYNKRIREIIAQITKVVEGGISSSNKNQYLIPLTEKNIVAVVDIFNKQHFDVDQKIMGFYQEIQEIKKSNIDYFTIEKLENKKFTTSIVKDVGENNLTNQLLLKDRKTKYQYSITSVDDGKSLKNSIASRQSTKVYVDSTTTTLTSLLSALEELKRLPVLFIFNSHDASQSVKDMKNLASALQNLKLDINVGIYFRFDNSKELNKEFNNLVSGLHYNKQLTNDTQIIGISNHKIPKFMFSEKWQAQSVVSFTNNFKNNKTSVYCNNVDLIVYYNDKAPLGDIDAIV